MRLSATRSLCAGGGAASISRRAIGDTAVASPVAALSTVTVSGGVAISRMPCRTRTGPITSVPGRWGLSRNSRVMVRTGPPTPSRATSITSREPTIVKPMRPGRASTTGSAERDRARMVSVSSSPAGTRVRSTRAVTSGGAALCKATSSHSAGVTSPSRPARPRAASGLSDPGVSSTPRGRSSAAAVRPGPG